MLVKEVWTFVVLPKERSIKIALIADGKSSNMLILLGLTTVMCAVQTDVTCDFVKR